MLHSAELKTSLALLIAMHKHFLLGLACESKNNAYSSRNWS